MEKESIGQIELVLKYIDEHGSISSWQAMKELGIMRLGSVISMMRKRGYNITTELEKTTTRYGRKTSYAVYRLVK